MASMLLVMWPALLVLPKASHQGMRCVEAIAGKVVPPWLPGMVPSCVYTVPQVASFGLTEQQAEKAGHAVKVGRFTSAGNGKSVVMGYADGLVKTIFDRNTGELLGAHMIGHGVSEQLQGYLNAKVAESTVEVMRSVVYPHPTLSEMMHESVLGVDVLIHQ